MEEQLIEVDQDDNRIGLRSRSEFFNSNHIHRAAHLILFNSENKILLQLRSKTKKVWPDLITFSVDCTVADETYEECIIREMQEEIGILTDVKKLFTFPYFDDTDKAWHGVFIGKTDDKITPDPGEIQEIRWMDADELRQDIKTKPEKYVPPFIKGMKIYFEEFYHTEK